MQQPLDSIRAIRRWMYSAPLRDFLAQDADAILGALLRTSEGDVELTQRNAWTQQIQVLKSLALPAELIADGRIYFELTVPRLGRRADVVLLTGPLMVILEFKVGESHFDRSAINQVWDYALDFKYFHESSHHIHVLPVLIATEASPRAYNLEQTIHNDGLYLPVCAATSQLASLLIDAITTTTATRIDVQRWEQGRYMPTPTIVEAARALYAGHRV